MTFAGTIEAKLDEKGRVFFPSEYRRQLMVPDAQLVVRRDLYQPCLVVYPLSVWQAEVVRVKRSLNAWDARQAMLFRKFMAEAHTVQLDASGRMLLPRRLAAACSMNAAVCFIGLDDRVELWAQEVMQSEFPSDDELAQSFGQLLAPLQAPDPIADL